MIRRKQHDADNRTTERGSMVVEFAFVLPLFLGAVGIMLMIGFSLWARFMVSNYAIAAARSCAFQMPLRPAQVKNCVSTYVHDAMSGHGFCTSIRTDASVDQVPLGNPNMRMLNVEVNCRTDAVPFVKLLPNQGSDGSDILTIRTGMPFLQ